MANYLLSHYKGKYRIKCEYDKETNQYQRKEVRNIKNKGEYIK